MIRFVSMRGESKGFIVRSVTGFIAEISLNAMVIMV